MEQQNRKMFARLDADLICHYKTPEYPFDPLMFFHNHDGYELFLMLDGKADFYTEVSAKRMERGDLFLIQPYSFHRIHVLSPERYVRNVINVRLPLMQQLSGKQSDLSAIFHRVPSNSINVIRLDESEIQTFLEAASELEEALHFRSFGDDVLTTACIQRILVKLNRHVFSESSAGFQEIMPDLIADIFAYIDTHLTDETLSVMALANHFHHDSAYISRYFKKICGTSLQQYIVAKKTALAQQYLRQGYSPCDACYLSGFRNYSNFSRTFSHRTGHSPKQYQLQALSHKDNSVF